MHNHRHLHQPTIPMSKEEGLEILFCFCKKAKREIKKMDEEEEDTPTKAQFYRHLSVGYNRVHRSAPNGRCFESTWWDLSKNQS